MNGAGSSGLLTRIATAGALAVAFILLTNWPTYHYLILGGPPPLVYYGLCGLIALPLVFLWPVAGIRVLKHGVFWWFLIYTIGGLLWLLLSQDFAEIANHQWRLRVLAYCLFCTVLIIVGVANRSIVAFAIFACVFIAGALNWFDALFPLRIVPRAFEAANPGRGAGLFLNANAAAAFALMGTIAALPHVRMRLRTVLLMTAIVAVAPTFSRFGLIFVVLLVVLAILLRMLDRLQVAVLFAAIPFVIAGAMLYHAHLLKAESANENIVARLAWFQSFGRQADFSARERAYVAQRALDKFLESPLYGHGLGATTAKGQRTGTHNVYLLLMVEQGLVGLALYLSLIAAFIQRGWRLVRSAVDAHGQDTGRAMLLYAIFLSLYGFASHNVLDEPHGMFILAFMVASAAGAAVSRRVHDARVVVAWPPKLQRAQKLS